MKVLLDTHTLIWWSENDARLGPKARTLIQDRETTLFVSSVSIYEMRLKDNLGKLASAQRLLQDVESYLRDQAIEILPLGFRHAELAGRLPLSHRDPFDQMLIAQSLVENLALVSNEATFDAFGVRRLW